MTASARAPFRLRPPDLADGLVFRPRLTDELSQRFDRRLSVVKAGAGFGKTTLLAQAVAENLLDPAGTDVWLQVLEHDRQPHHLLAGLATALATALDNAGGYAEVASIDDVVNLVWSRAPEQLSLVLDDVHLIDGSPSMALLADLCNRLPTNAHLLLGTRTTPTLPVRQLQARGQAVILDEGDLAFTQDEQIEFARVRNMQVATGADLPSWPALAVLMSSVGHPASIDFLWDAVLQSLPVERRRALALLVRFGRVDDELVDAVLGAAWSASSLLAGLPLIESRDGAYRFHDLWRAALADTVDHDQWQTALTVGAEVLIARGELVRGARCLQAAGATDRLVGVARDFGASSISAGLSGAVAEALIDCLPISERNGALGQYLRTIETSSFQSDRVLRDLRGVFRTAIAAGDQALATLALWRETQLLSDVGPSALSGPEAADLRAAVQQYATEGWPLARCALALINSHAAEQAQDVPAALAAVSLFEGPDPAVVRASATSRYIALGHPEHVDVTLDEVLAQGINDPVSAQAVWFRGEIDPSVAWPIVRELPAEYSRRRLPNVQVPLLGVLTSVALAAGDIPAARKTADDALDLARRLLARPALFARVADALVVLAVDGEEGAAERFQSMLRDVPLHPWPSWAYLGSLCAMRALVPDTEWLDRISFGLSISTAVAAGKAVVALRRDLDPTPAIELPWTSIVVMRVHVPPSMLCELAVAASASVPAAAAHLDTVRATTPWVQRLVDHPHNGTRAAARALTAGTPVRPHYALDVATFGEFAIRRSDGIAVSDRVRGGRVQQLVARMLLDGTPLRTAIAQRLWPDLGEKQAGSNLRVTLGSLLDSIEPDRRAGTSWFVRSNGGRLELVDIGVSVDVRSFEAHVAAAREAERSGRLTVALEHHCAAFALYAGPFMPGLADSDVEHERLRLQTLAYASGCRLGELLLAKGEPEDALRALVDATRIDPFAERSRRTEIRCHLALGSAWAARTTARNLRVMLRDQNLAADRETDLLLAKVDPSQG